MMDAGNANTEGEAVLELDHVTKLYGEFRAVDDVSFSIPRGAIYGFLGPNGAGKTTTIRIILEIIRPTEGRVSVFGSPSALAVRQRIGYLPEEKGLYKKMRAWSVIAYFATLKGMNRRDAKRRAYELLEQYGLGDFADARTEALSKGMGQKVQVLAAIAHKPDLVILDEPFSGLDPVNQSVMEEVIKEIAQDGRTVLFSTHVMQHAERICDQILLVAGGKKIFDGSIDEARRSVPHRVRVATPGDPSAFDTLPGVCEVREPEGGSGADAGERELVLADGADPQEILRACFDRRIELSRFDHTLPSLHEAFVSLVGPEAREARTR